MKRVLTTILTFVVLCATAQISEYQHPCSIIGQEEISTPKNQPFTPSLNSLIIHDVDDNIGNTFDLKLLKGENYKIQNGEVIPNKGFTGLLTVNIQINDGTFDSDPFGLKVQVGERVIDESKIIYVAENGDDSANGSISHPLKTLQRAKELVRETGAEMVYFREGEYFSNRSVVFESDDSGDEQSPIIYSAYPGEQVRFTGSVKLPYEEFDKPKPHQVELIENMYVRAKIKVFDLKARGITDYGELDHVGYAVRNEPIPTARLFVDGAAMQIARYPNVGNFDDVQIVDGATRVTRNVGKNDHVDTEENKLSFKSKSGVMFNWQEKDDIWIDGSMSKAWEWQKNKIARIDADSTITMSWEYHSKIGVQAVKMFYFNIFEELDFPEEYYIDDQNGLLYVYFPSSISESSDIRLTQSRESIIVLDSVEHITFKNITFEGSRNSAISTLKGSSFNKFENCEIRSCGLDGIILDGYSNRVKNCLIHNVGSNGVVMKGGDRDNMIPAGNIVENTKIHDFSQERRVYHPGLNMSGIGQIARHIELYNGPHMAARISGTNHIIEYSDFHDAPHEYSDMLGIYLCTGGDLFSRGTTIRRNKFHDVSGSWKQSAGVYMDNETNGVVVEENYFYDNIAQERGWSVMIHGGGDNMVRRNVFVDCSYPFCISTRLNGYARDWFEGIIKRWEEQAQERLNKKWIESYPEMAHYFADEGKRVKPNGPYELKLKYDKDGEITNYWNLRTPSTNVFVDNLVYNSDPSIFVMPETTSISDYENRDYYSVMSFRVKDGVMQECLIHDNNHNVTENPGFLDYTNHNLQVKEGAAITTPLPHLSDDYYQRIGLSDKSLVGVK
ncbi:MAG: right-handed parallel beta-helix repeat-containing protein [Rikenellaceae bacterium]